VGWNVSVSYNAGLGRYLLCTEHDATMGGNLGMFDAPEPWGPWATVGYYSDWEGFGTTFFWNFSNKWLSADGRDFTIVFTGVGDNDSWNTVRGSFQATVVADPDAGTTEDPDAGSTTDDDASPDDPDAGDPGSDNSDVGGTCGCAAGDERSRTGDLLLLLLLALALGRRSRAI
jgi:MYXO-CTERM domain-containing protein